MHSIELKIIFEKINNNTCNCYYRADLIEDPLEISFVSWPMVRYRREVIFGWVDLLGMT